MATHSSNLAWEIPRTEEPEGLPSLGPLKSQPWLSDQTTLSTRLTASYLLLQIFKWKHREVKQQVHSHTARKWPNQRSQFCTYLWPWRNLILCHGWVAFTLRVYFVLHDMGFDPHVICDPIWWLALYSELPLHTLIQLSAGESPAGAVWPGRQGDSLVPACDYMGGLGASSLLWVSFPVN